MGTKKGLAEHAKSFAKNQAMQYAAKKLGLGSLFNPAMMLFSLFNKFGRGKKPAFDMEAASKLGLHANRFATTGGQLPTIKQYAKDLTTPKAKISTQIAKGTGLGSGAELLGLKDIKGHRAEQLTLPGMQNMPSGYPWSVAGEGASPQSWIRPTAAEGGRMGYNPGGLATLWPR